MPYTKVREVWTDNVGQEVNAAALNQFESGIATATSIAEQAASSVALKAPIASPSFSGIPTCPTPATTDNTTRIANCALVDAKISAAGVGGGSSAIDSSTDTVSVIATSATTNLDMGGRRSRYFRVTLSANTTFAFINVPANVYSEWSVELIQDATGGRTVGWPATRWIRGIAPSPSTDANDVNVLNFWTPEGTQYRGFFILEDGAAPGNVTAPGAPTVTSVTPGDGSLTVAFSPPASNGGATILEYEALEEAVV